jgi:hypothetical protein
MSPSPIDQIWERISLVSLQVKTRSTEKASFCGNENQQKDAAESRLRPPLNCLSDRAVQFQAKAPQPAWIPTNMLFP